SWCPRNSLQFQVHLIKRCFTVMNNIAALDELNVKLAKIHNRKQVIPYANDTNLAVQLLQFLRVDFIISYNPTNPKEKQYYCCLYSKTSEFIGLGETMSLAIVGAI